MTLVEECSGAEFWTVASLRSPGMDPRVKPEDDEGMAVVSANRRGIQPVELPREKPVEMLQL